jgi:hypothetical protein
MTAQSSTTDQETFGQNPPQQPPGRSRTRSLAMMAGAVALLAGVFVTLVFGIAIGNAVRKRIDRWMHGYK